LYVFCSVWPLDPAFGSHKTLTDRRLLPFCSLIIIYF
jgi:hypothetical protein